MICPNCKQAMIVVEHQQVELDYCPTCEGVWFDSGELDLLLDTAKLGSPDKLTKEVLSSPEVKTEHKQRRCPICSRGMQERAIGQPTIHIDICSQGDGIWFDGGEVYQLLMQLSHESPAKESSQQELIGFLGEVFKAQKNDPSR